MKKLLVALLVLGAGSNLLAMNTSEQEWNRQLQNGRAAARLNAERAEVAHQESLARQRSMFGQASQTWDEQMRQNKEAARLKAERDLAEQQAIKEHKNAFGQDFTGKW